MPFPLAAVLSLAGTLAATGTNFAMQNKANRRIKSLAEEQYQRSKADTQAMNAYNSPSSQIVRLRSAGISPAMFYGQGGIQAGNQSSIPSYDRAEYVAPTIDAQAVVSSFTDVSRLSNETGYNNAMIKKIEKDSKLLDQTFNFNEENNPTLLEQARQNLKVSQAQEDQIRANIENIWSQKGLNDMKIKEVCQQMQIDYGQFCMAVAKWPHEVWEMDSRTFTNYMSAHKMEQDIALGWAMLNETIRHNQVQETIGFKQIQLGGLQTLANWKIQRTSQVVGVNQWLGNNAIDLMQFGQTNNPLATIFQTLSFFK